MKRLAVSLLLCCPVVAEPFKIHRIGRPETANRWEVSSVAYDTKWLGTLSTDWDEAGNWSNGVPDAVTNVDVLVDSDAVNDLLLNIDRTSDTAGAGLHLTSFHIHESTTIRIGGPGNPMKFTCDTFKNRSPKPVYWTSATGSGGLGSDRVIQYGTGYYELESSGAASVAGRFQRIEVISGNGRLTLNQADAADVDRLIVGGREPGPVVLLTGASDITDLIVSSGYLTIETTTSTSTIAKVLLAGGTVQYLSGHITGVVQFAGTFYHNQPAASDKIGTYMGRGGVLDMSQTPWTKVISYLNRDDYDGDFTVLGDDRLISADTTVTFGQ